MLRFTLPEGTHTWYETLREDGKTVRMLRAEDGDTVEESALKYPTADYFVGAGMAVRIEE